MRQIFILEKDELTALRQGEPLVILLGKESITLQADVVRKQAASNGAATDKRTKAYKEANGNRGTITDRVVEYVQDHGPATCKEIAANLGVGRASVASALNRFKGVKLRRTGKFAKALWRAKI
jgi:hypothetical protein